MCIILKKSIAHVLFNAHKMLRSLEIDSLPFAQQQRLRFLESMVLWEGTIKRQRVCDVFGVNPNHVTRDIQIYKRQYPKNIEYYQSQRAYGPGEKFSPKMASGDPNEYLTLLYAYAESRSVAMLPVLGGEGLPVEVVAKPKRTIDQELLRGVVQATRQGKGIKVIYSSMASDRPAPRTLWPHSLVHTGLNWHVRAFDDQRKEFRNFAIQRITNLNVVDTQCSVSKEMDHEWHEKVLVEVIANPKLNAHQQEIVGREYGMTKRSDGRVWSEEIRQCLVGYFAVHYRLDLQEHKNALHTPLVFKDPLKVKPYLFGSDTSGD